MDRKNRCNIGLIGFMATGKTVIGNALATHLHLDFIDTDTVITEKIGKSISEIFSDEGEEVFRKLEREVIQEVCQTDSHVISFGGGAVLSQINVKTIRENNTVVLLTASPDTISSRIKSSNLRPLLNGNSAALEDNVKTLLAQREAHYRAAMDFMIDTERKSVSKIVDEISRRLQQ